MPHSETGAAIRGGYADTPLGQIHYRSCGQGPAPALLLVHPAPRSALIFRRLMFQLEALGAGAKGRRVIAIDLPGFGNSCALPAGTSMSGIAGTVVDALEHLGLTQVDLFGLHSGNKVAAALAAEWPDRVRRFALAGMTHSIIIDAEKRNAAMQAYVKNKKPVDPAEDPDAYRDEQVDRLNSLGYDALYAANYAFDLSAALARVRARSLVIELAVPEEAVLGRQGAALCALMPNARSIELPCSDRELLQRRPAVLARELLAFFDADSPL